MFGFGYGINLIELLQMSRIFFIKMKKGAFRDVTLQMRLNFKMAEAEGLEPPRALKAPAVFKTVS
jgi:hypothetical protein